MLGDIKTNILCFFILIFFLTPQAISLEENTITIQKDADIRLTYHFPVPSIETRNGYDYVTIAKLTYSETLGRPILPVQAVPILLPPDTKVEAITVSYPIIQNLTGFFHIANGQQPIPYSYDGFIQETLPDPSIYTSHHPYPGYLFKEIGVQKFRGFNILVLTLFPLQYIPSAGILSYYPEITISITTTKDSTSTILFRGTDEDTSQVMKKIANPEILSSYYEMPSTQLSTKPYSLLILTTNELKPGFQRLADTHKKDGILTMIKTLGVDVPIGSDYNTTCENIRTFIRNEYVSSNIEYVLLGGDQDVIPARTLYVVANDSYPAQDLPLRDQYETFMPSDLYYGCLDGPFNFDGDEKWGEPTDGKNGGDVDLLAEVYVGRACVGNLTEVGFFVNKTLAYMERGSHDEYLREVLLLGEWMGGPPQYPHTYGDDSMEELVTGSEEYGTVGIPHDEFSLYNFTRLYDRDWPGFDPEHPYNERWEAEDLLPLLNRGTHFVYHMGHSGPHYNLRLCLSMYQNDLADLSNEQYFFVYSQGCDAGAFDRDICQNPPIPDCIAEYLTVKLPSGAFAGIWNARYGFYIPNCTDGPSQRYHREFVDALYGENITVLSIASQDSKEDNLYRINEDCMRWCYYELNYFGDPAIDYQILQPLNNIGVSQLNISHQIPSHQLVSVQTMIVNSGQKDEKNVTVVLSIGENQIKSIVVPLFLHHTVQNIIFTFMTPSAGVYNFTVETMIQGVIEEFYSDNIKQKTVLVGVLNNNTKQLYNSIQQAIDDHETLAGDVLFIPQGIYHENLLVTKPLTLIGETKDNTLLIGGSPVTSTSRGAPTILIKDTESVTITGFTITHKSQYPASDFIMQDFQSNMSSIKPSGCGIILISARWCYINNNTILSNLWGIFCSVASNNNRFYRNNFIANVHQAYDMGVNCWNESYPDGGNYWGNWNGGVFGLHDDFQGVFQDIPGDDGFLDQGDEDGGLNPFAITGGSNNDWYPLVNAYE
ncbi:MAG: C25 family cysteine peptidase [Methanobacteriota archaeon]